MNNQIIAYQHLLRQLEKELEFHYNNLDKTDDFYAKAKIYTKIQLLEYEIDSLTNDILRWKGMITYETEA